MFPRSPRSRPVARVRSVATLGMVGILAVPLIGWSNAVAVTVDGELHGLRTYASTVGDVLDQLELEVGPADRITPAPTTEVSDGLSIEVARAITVDVVVDGGLARRVTAPIGSVAGALHEAGLGDVRERGAEIRPGWTAPVEDGDAVHVRLPKDVTVVADGEAHELVTVAGTVRTALAEADVPVRGRDELWPPLDAPIDGPTRVVVQRVEADEEVVETPIPHEEERRESSDLLRGRTEVAREGQDGLLRETYQVRTLDGEEVQRELVRSERVREPVSRVVLVGTKAPPPPPKPKPAPTTSSSSGADLSVWDRLARCESGGNWSYRGTYHGGLQFHPDTWRRHKPSGYPAYAYDATRLQQIEVGKRVQRAQGWSAWPACSSKLGLR